MMDSNEIGCDVQLQDQEGQRGEKHEEENLRPNRVVRRSHAAMPDGVRGNRLKQPITEAFPARLLRVTNDATVELDSL